MLTLSKQSSASANTTLRSGPAKNLNKLPAGVLQLIDELCTGWVATPSAQLLSNVFITRAMGLLRVVVCAEPYEQEGVCLYDQYGNESWQKCYFYKHLPMYTHNEESLHKLWAEEQRVCQEVTICPRLLPGATNPFRLFPRPIMQLIRWYAFEPHPIAQMMAAVDAVCWRGCIMD